MKCCLHARKVNELKNYGLIFAEQLALGQREDQSVADMARWSRDRNSNWSFDFTISSIMMAIIAAATLGATLFVTVNLLVIDID